MVVNFLSFYHTKNGSSWWSFCMRRPFAKNMLIALIVATLLSCESFIIDIVLEKKFVYMLVIWFDKKQTFCPCWYDMMTGYVSYFLTVKHHGKAWFSLAPQSQHRHVRQNTKFVLQTEAYCVNLSFYCSCQAIKQSAKPFKGSDHIAYGSLNSIKKHWFTHSMFLSDTALRALAWIENVVPPRLD